MKVRRCLLLTVLSLGLTLIEVSDAQAAQQPPLEIEVVSSGTGTNEKEALVQAFSNAVMSAVGVVVDAETIVKNDQIIQDQVLTASNAFITRYEQLGEPKLANGIVTVRIKAVVQRRQLEQRLQQLHVASAAVDGGDVFAQVVTELQREKDVKTIVKRVFEGFPGNVITAQPVGQPRVISKDQDEATIGVTVRFGVDMTRYGAWYRSFVPLLSKLAHKVEERRWDPNKSVRAGATLDESWLPPKGIAVALSPDEVKRSYMVRDGKDVLPGVDESVASLIVFERQGSSKYVALAFAEEVRAELQAAAFSLPVVEVVLKDAAGDELDGQEQVAVFQGSDVWGRQYGAYAWLLRDKEFSPTLDNVPDTVSPDWTPTDSHLERLADRGLRLVVLPYLSYGWALAVPSFSYEFQFKMPLERLQALTSVEVKIRSTNRP